MAAPSPWAAISSLALRCTIKINGTELPDDYGISSVSITHKTNTISTAELSIAGSYPADFSSLPAVDDDTFTPGNEIIISAGYSDSGADTLFDGYIVNNSVEFSGDQPVVMSISCKHKAVAMTYQRRDQEFQNKKDSEIITSLLTDNNLTATVDATTYVNPQFVQSYATDWDILSSRAEVNGFLILLDDDKIKIGKPDFSSSAVLTIAAGNALLDFKAQISAEKQYTSVTACSWDSDTASLVSATAAEPKINSQGATTIAKLSSSLNQKAEYFLFATPMEESDLQKFADGRLMRIRLSALTGSFSFVGSSLVKTGSIITLQGVGAIYSGDAFISSVTHSISGGLWKTSVEFGLENKSVSDQPDYASSATSKQVPPVQGLKLAKVVKLSADPQEEYRIKVSLLPAPTDAPSIEIWARYINFYATNGSGLGFMPEVGDEVVLGFAGNDPGSPFVLGSVYSKTNVAANSAKDENNYIKSLTTKEKLTLSFDDQNKIIIIKTPGANTITISDDGKSIELLDQTKNSVKLSEDGIVLTSKKDLKMTATGDITIDATGGLTLTSKKDMSATSEMNISHEAKLGFTGKGTSTAEVSATGSTTIKGGTVMIN